MAVEIGSLVVRGTFGQAPREAEVSDERLRLELLRLRQQMLQDMREMLETAERRARER
jgi:hypothetical protein